MTKILVTGSNGQVGSELRALAEQFTDFEFLFTDRSQLDIGSKENIESILLDFKPHYLINAAAYTAVDKAESELENAQLINATAVSNMATLCGKHGIWFMHISTDYVYHLLTEQPLKEDYMTQPQGVYAKTKLDGENLLSESTADYCILRTSWVYSYYGHNFVKTMLRLGRSKDELTIVADQIGTPTYAKDIAACLLEMITIICASEDRTKYKGVYNFSNGGETHWADFARKIFELEKIECEVKETTTEEYGAPAPRPKWSVLDKSRITQKFGIEIIDWEQSLQHCLDRLHKDPST